MKSVQNSPSLRKASDPYTIYLENNDYTLTEEELKKCIDNKTLKLKGWFFPSLKLLSFKDQTAELTNTHENTSYKLYIKVEKDKLHVGCSCAEQVEKLCIHAYKALDKLLLYREATDYFKHFKT